MLDLALARECWILPTICNNWLTGSFILTSDIPILFVLALELLVRETVSYYRASDLATYQRLVFFLGSGGAGGGLDGRKAKYFVRYIFREVRFYVGKKKVLHPFYLCFQILFSVLFSSVQFKFGQLCPF
jgi:hypothetical protein